jgi:hypothetical protein
MTAQICLEALLLEMAVGGADRLSLCFSDRVDDIAKQTLGFLLFDVRLDRDPHYQRLAAIQYPTLTVGLLALDRSGSSIRTCAVNGAFAGFLRPVSVWARLPLAEQAITHIRGESVLLLEALRNAGHLATAPPIG